MPKAIVIEDEQLEHAFRVAKVSSPENGCRDAALLLTCFGTGMTVTEICRLRVSDYLTQSRCTYKPRQSGLSSTRARVSRPRN